MRRSFVVVLALCIAAGAAQAGLTVIGKGDKVKIDPSGFPSDMKERYALMEARCNGNKDCHGMSRAVEAVMTGIAPNSKTPFDRQAAKQYGIKMMRKPDSGINKEDAKSIVELLYFLIDEQAKK
jgi:hypothetical protein